MWKVKLKGNFFKMPAVDVRSLFSRKKTNLASQSSYKDRQFEGDVKTLQQKLDSSSTLYVGNLSFFTTEFQVILVFSGECVYFDGQFGFEYKVQKKL